VQHGEPVRRHGTHPRLPYLAPADPAQSSHRRVVEMAAAYGWMVDRIARERLNLFSPVPRD
jgi:hypothetical protein